MQPRTRSKQAWRRLPVLFVGAALVVSACASDDDDEATDTTSGSEEVTETTFDATAVLGDPNPATGEPITIGFVSDGVSDAVDRTSEITAAEAAVEYVNEYLGGLGGQPIELDVCETGATPAGAADCVTQMVTNDVPVVINGLTSVPGDLYVPLASAGIPVFSGGAIERGALSTPGIYLMGNPLLAVLAGPAQVAADNGVTNVSIMVVDNPAASGQLEAAAPLFYGNVDVAVEVVTIPIDTPDVTPEVTAALGSSPGLIQVVGDATFCGKVMRALDTVGYDGLIVIISACLEEGANTDLPNLEGSIMIGTSSTDPEAEEVQLYNAVLDTYVDGDLDRGNNAVAGYQAVVGFARAVEGLTGEVTAESIIAAIAAMPETPFPLADGLTYQCDLQQVPTLAPNICSQDALVTSLDAEGNGTEYTVLDGATVLTLG